MAYVSKNHLDAVLRTLFLAEKMFFIWHLLDLYLQINITKPSPHSLLRTEVMVLSLSLLFLPLL